ADEYSDGYLVICSYGIALLDLISAVLFGGVSGMLYGKYHRWTSLALLIFAIIWVWIICMLLLGIYRRRILFVRFWLMFTCLGILLDTVLLIYGLTLAMSINWEGVKVTMLPFVGLCKFVPTRSQLKCLMQLLAAVEMTFVYIVYLFYMEMLEREQWIPLTNPPAKRSTGGCIKKFTSSSTNSTDTMLKERRRLKRMYKREEKQAMRELRRKLRR
ncbi:CG14151, partial [Drosophila busckii]